MKLHLPKQLFSALLSAITLAAAPLALTLGSNAWGGWYATDTYCIDTKDTGLISTIKQKSANLFIRSCPGGDQTQSAITAASIQTLQTFSGDKIIIDGTWKDASAAEFKNLVIENLNIGSNKTAEEIINTGSASLTVAGNNTATIQALNGTLSSVTIETNSSLTIGAATLSSVTNAGTLTLGAATVSSVTNAGTLNLRGTLTGAGDGGAISGGTVNVDVDALSIMNFEGYHFTDFDGNALANSAIQHGFLKGTQTLTVFKNISVTNASGTAANLTNGQYTYTNTDSTFYVNDSWNFDADESSGASAYYVGSNGVLNMDLSVGTGQLLLTKPVFSAGTLNIEAGTKAVNLSSIFTANNEINGGSVLTQTADALVSITTTGAVSASSAVLSSPGTVQINNAASFTNDGKKLSGGKLVLSGVKVPLSQVTERCPQTWN